MTNSRAKGKRGELEASHFLQSLGFECRRGQQFAGGNDSPDLVHNLEGIHFEVKRCERFNLYAALDQANKDKKPADDAVVLHRTSRRDWVVVLDAAVFLKLLKDYVYAAE